MDIRPEFLPDFPMPKKAVLPVKQHAGIPAVPLVKIGDGVHKGQKIADIPDCELGAPIHAPIDGKIIAIGQEIAIAGM